MESVKRNTIDALTLLKLLDISIKHAKQQDRK
jgi:hypothetical protein